MEDLTLEQFLSQTWGSGMRYIAAIKHDGSIVQFKTTTAEDASKRIKTLAKNTDKYQGVFFTPFMFALKARGRKEADILSTKVLFADVDVGEHKPYKNREEAAQAITEFFATTNFPKPTYAFISGNGFHLYWVMERELPSGVGIKAQRLLKQLCLNRGLQIDSAVTGNPTIVMRALETFNAKDMGNLKRVQLAGGTGEIFVPEQLLDAFGQFGLALMAAPTGADLSVNDELTAGIERPKAFMSEIVKKCPLLGHIRDTRGATCTEPLWMGTLQLCRFVEDGAEWIHPLSSGHPGYTPAGTEHKFQLRGTGGPTVCARFEEYAVQAGMDFCAQCGHRDTIKTPFTLGIDHTVTEQVLDELAQDKEDADVLACQADGVDIAAAADYPLGWPGEYTRHRGALVRPKEKKPGEFTAQTVLHGYIDRVEYVRIKRLDMAGTDIGSSHFVDLYWRTDWRNPNSTHCTTCELSALASPQTTINNLAKAGFVTLPGEQLELVRFMTSYIQRLQKLGKVTQAASGLGWGLDSDGRAYFAIPGARVFADGTEDDKVRVDNTIAAQYMPRGSLEEWQKAANFLAQQDHAPLVTLLAASFAAPLLDLIGVSGAVLAAVSFRSGVGKSDALKIAQAVWGDPTTTMASLNDTMNSLEQRLGTVRHLPVFWDEIRGSSSVEQFVTQTFRITEGQTRGRLSHTTEQRPKLAWKTMLIVASNDDLMEPFERFGGQNDAGVARLLQFYVPPPPRTMGMMDTAALMQKSHRNYGHAGAVYARYIAMNRDMIIKEIHRVGNDLENELNTETTERFWFATVAALLVGAAIAKGLRLVDFNLSTLRGFLLETVRNMRGHKQDVADTLEPLDVIREYVRAKQTSTLVTDRARARGDKQLVEILQIPSPGNPANAHAWTEDDGVHYRIPARALRDWVRQKGYNVRTLLAQIPRSVLLYDNATVRYCAGTSYQVDSLRCYEFVMPSGDHDS